MEAQILSFSMTDKSSGYEATPKRVRLQALADFAADVSTLLRGSQRDVDPEKIDVSIRTGSVVIQTAPIAAAPALLRDLRALESSEMLDTIDAKRRSVVERWQRSARQEPNVAYKITAPFLDKAITVNGKSDYRANDADQWIMVERYVTGEIENVGGASKPNAHIRLPDGSTLIVATDRHVLKDDPQNRVYKQAMLRIRARYNVLTRELRDAQLIEFVEYSPEFDAAAMERLTQRGAKAWKDIEDAGAWVDDLRGGRD